MLFEKVGFESEYFIRDGSGIITPNVPSTFPRDGAGHLVEVRSAPCRRPSDAFDSMADDLQRVEKLISKQNYQLVCLNRHTFGVGFTEKAGCHIHFSHTTRQMDIPLILRLMDTKFRTIIEAAGRELSQYRIKPWGFEYRSLPTEISGKAVAAYLEEIQGMVPTMRMGDPI